LQTLRPVSAGQVEVIGVDGRNFLEQVLLFAVIDVIGDGGRGGIETQRFVLVGGRRRCAHILRLVGDGGGLPDVRHRGRLPYYNMPFFYDYYQREFHWTKEQITFGFPLAAC
jgi:hypothetical protein